MIRQLADPANAITVSGLVLSIVGIHFVLAGRLEIGVAVVLWALLADHLDGVVASRTLNRAKETGLVGKSLDSLADLVSAGIFPAVMLIKLCGGSVASLVTGAILVVASALRLSYFNAVGLDGGCFIGVPTTYAVPLTAVMFLLAPLVPGNGFPFLFNIALLVLACLHVASVRIPRTTGWMYAVVTLFAISASAFLAVRGLS